MSDLTPTGADISAPANDAPLSIREAAESFIKRRDTQDPPQEEARAPIEEPEVPPAERNSSKEDTAAADTDQPPGDDDQGQVDPADEQPSIEPPRSWTKEEKEAFKLLPPEHQQRIAERERTREADIRRGQDEVAKERKALEAKLSEADKVRQQYEAALPQLMQQLNAQYQAEFSDITSQADVLKMAEEDPLRYLKYDALQKQRQSTWTQHQQAQARQHQEKAERFTSWAAEQDKLATERVPELADPEKGQKVRQEAASYLKEVTGWDDDRLGRMWMGQEPFSIRDASFQQILRDASRWKAAQTAAKAAAAKPLPPVQRPGIAQSKGDAQQAQIKTLETRLERASSTREQLAIAAQLRTARRQAGAR